MGGVLLAAPVNLVVTIAALPMEPVHLSARGVAGLLYIAAVSQFPGFVVWYRGMALMGVTRASQLRSTPWKAHPREDLLQGGRSGPTPPGSDGAPVEW